MARSNVLIRPAYQQRRVLGSGAPAFGSGLALKIGGPRGEYGRHPGTGRLDGRVAIEEEEIL
jgi:hypothetical protein